MGRFIGMLLGIQLIPLLFAWLVSGIMAEHILFWIFGVWVPWWVGGLIGLFVPVVFPIWAILWILTFVPAIHFPLIIVR